MDSVDQDVLCAVLDAGVEVIEGVAPVEDPTWAMMCTKFNADTGSLESGPAFLQARSLRAAEELATIPDVVQEVLQHAELVSQPRGEIDQGPKEKVKRFTLKMPQQVSQNNEPDGETEQEGERSDAPDWAAYNSVCSKVAKLLQDPSLPPVTIHGSLVLSGEEITTLPFGFRITDNLIIHRAHNLREVPDDLRVGGSFRILSCQSIEEFPKGVRIGGDLDLRLCSAFKTLPNGLNVRGNLLMSGCNMLRKLPKKLKVGGQLELDGCMHLVKLPEKLSVGGTLSLLGCSSLEAISGELQVGANLILTGCTSLSHLPDGLEVYGDLDLSWCSSLIALPPSLKLHSSLYLAKCDGLSSLPPNFHVEQNLYITNCTTLKEIGDGLTVGQSLLMLKCTSLKNLPPNFHVGKHLNLNECTELVDLGGDLTVAGSLTLQKCLALTTLPKILDVGLHFNLTKCTNVTSVPEKLKVGGFLKMIECDGIRNLPLQLEVAGAVVLEKCNNLTSLPEGFTIRKGLYLRQCPALASLPEGLRVGGFLGLAGCSGLTSLPEELMVGGSVDLSDCTSLTRLPEQLVVHGSLTASNTAITALPSELVVDMSLNVENCRQLDSLPSSVLDWEPQADGRPHEVFLGGSGLSLETLDWLRESDAPNLRFHVSLRNQENFMHGDKAVFLTLKEAYTFWLNELRLPAPEKVPKIDPAHLPSVLQFLSRLRGAKEFGLSDTRRALAKRVGEVLELLQGEEEVRTEVVQRMMDSLDACNDKPVWALNQLTLVANCVRCRGDRVALKDLGRRVLRLMIVHEHAQKKIASLSWVDDVCVYLKMEIELRHVLSLPVAASAMHFPTYIKITDEDLEAAKEEALSVTEEQFESWLEDWPEWKRQLRTEVAASLKWKDLPRNKRRSLLRRSLSNLLGVRSSDPVMFRGATWSLSELLRHWVSTGLDLHNSPLSGEDLVEGLTRIG